MALGNEVEEKLLRARSAMVREMIVERARRAEAVKINPEIEDALLQARSALVAGIVIRAEQQQH